MKNATAKILAEKSIDLFFIISFRSLVVCLLVLALGFILGGTYRIRLKHYHSLYHHIARGFLGLFVLFTFLMGIETVPLAEAIVLDASSIVFLGIIGVVVDGDKINKYNSSAWLLCGCGVLVLVDPTFNNPNIGHVYILVSSALFSAMIYYGKWLTKYERSYDISFFFFLMGGLASLLFLDFDTGIPAEIHSPTMMLNLAAFSVLSFLISFLTILSLTKSKVISIAPAMFTTFAWGALLQFIIWRQAPSISFYIACILIIAGVMILKRRENPTGGTSI